MLLPLLVTLLARAAPMDWPHEPGTHQLERTIDGATVRFTLHVPFDLPKRKKPAIVLALHYAGHGAPHYATGYVSSLVAPGLDGLDAVIVAPDCPGSRWTDPAAASTTLALLDAAVEEWRGDPKRIYVTGYSMGAMGAWYLIATHPERFSAAIPIAGHPRDHGATVTTPVYAIHGRRDELIPATPTEQTIRAMQQRGARAHFDAEPELSHYDVARYVPALKRAVAWLSQR